jgi:Zn-dependent protease with chaperone function
MTLLTLNRDLDSRPHGEIVGVIAHELAHLALGHRFVSWEGKRKVRLREEYEADALACQWGFEEELKAALEALTGLEEEARRRRERVS